MSKLDTIRQNTATFALSSRVDIRHLATLAAFWLSHGERPNSISELTRLSIESLSELLVLNKEIDFINTNEAALEVLTRSSLISPQKNANYKALKKVLLAEQGSLSTSSLTTSLDPLTGPATTSSKSTYGVTDPELSTAQATFENLVKQDTEDRITAAHSRTEEFKSHLGAAPTPSSTPIKETP